MFKKHFTIVIIPQKTSKVRKIQVPTRLFVLFLTSLLLLVGGGVYMVYDYQRLTQLFAGENLETLNQRYQNQAALLSQYHSAWQQVSQHVELLEELHEKLKKLTDPKIETAVVKRQTIQPKPDDTILDWIDSEQALNGNGLDSIARAEALLNYFEDIQNPMSQIPNEWPVRGILLSSFGSQTNPFAPQDEVEGIVIGTLSQATIQAPADGIVISAGPDPVHGFQIQIYHIYELVTQYNRLSKLSVTVGDKIAQGQTIGTVGNQGTFNAPHLVYKVYLNHIPQNPIDYVQRKLHFQYP